MFRVTGDEEDKDEDEEEEGVATLGNMLTLLWSQVRGVRSSWLAWLLLVEISGLTLSLLLVSA